MAILTLTRTLGLLLLIACHVETKVCHSDVDGDDHECDDEEECCSSEDYPCCLPVLPTEIIVVIAVSGTLFIILGALIAYTLYRTYKRREARKVAGTSGTVQSVHVTTSVDGGYSQAPNHSTHPAAFASMDQTYGPRPVFTSSDPAYPPT